MPLYVSIYVICVSLHALYVSLFALYVCLHLFFVSLLAQYVNLRPCHHGNAKFRTTEVLNIVYSGHNAVVTGQAGTGKS